MARRFVIDPCSLAAANLFISEHHRHAGAVQAAIYSCSLRRRYDGTLIGVGVLGRPLSRLLDDGRTLEVRRIATDGTEHACSAIYGALLRAARQQGALRIVTYTRETESGGSLRAAGFHLDEQFHRTFDFVGTKLVKRLEPKAARSWDTPSRPREKRALGTGRFRWWYVTPEGRTPDGAMRLGAAASKAGQVNGCSFQSCDPLYQYWREGFNYPNWENWERAA